MAMILEEPEEKPTEEPTWTTDKREVAEVTYTTTKLSLLAQVIQIGKEIVGIVEPIETVDDTIDVIIDKKIVANIPTGSKFVGIVPHKQCLEYQYGTDLWYECEASP